MRRSQSDGYNKFTQSCSGALSNIDWTKRL